MVGARVPKMPPAKVEVAEVEVALTYATTASPAIESFAYGEVVPTPKLPVESQIPDPGKYAVLKMVIAVDEA